MISITNQKDQFQVKVNWEKAKDKYSFLMDDDFTMINNTLLLDQVVIKEVCRELKVKLASFKTGITINITNQHKRVIIVSLSYDTLDTGKIIYSTLYK